MISIFIDLISHKFHLLYYLWISLPTYTKGRGVAYTVLQDRMLAVLKYKAVLNAPLIYSIKRKSDLGKNILITTTGLC